MGPSIPADVAERLAVRSDKVASRLESGDSCGAQREAAALRTDLTASVHEIPELYLEDLSGLVNEIQAQIPLCAQKPRLGDRGKKPHDDDKKGKNEKKDEKKKKKEDEKKGKKGEEADDEEEDD